MSKHTTRKTTEIMASLRFIFINMIVITSENVTAGVQKEACLSLKFNRSLKITQFTYLHSKIINFPHQESR